MIRGATNSKTTALNARIADLRDALLTAPCPGGGWNGMPAEIADRGATVADCLKHGVCGCSYGEVVKKAEGRA